MGKVSRSHPHTREEVTLQLLRIQADTTKEGTLGGRCLGNIYTSIFFLLQALSVSFLVCPWIFFSAAISLPQCCRVCVCVCKYMWRREVSFSVILGHKSTLTWVDRLAGKLQGPSWVWSSCPGMTALALVFTSIRSSGLCSKHFLSAEPSAQACVFPHSVRRAALSLFVLTW